MQFSVLLSDQQQVLVKIHIPHALSLRAAVQVGMQNSALGAVLATLHFADPLTAIPCAISATTHSLLGSAFAGFWRSRDPGEVGEENIMGQQESERVTEVATGGNSISDAQIREAQAKAREQRDENSGTEAGLR